MITKKKNLCHWVSWVSPPGAFSVILNAIGPQALGRYDLGAVPLLSTCYQVLSYPGISQFVVSYLLFFLKKYFINNQILYVVTWKKKCMKIVLDNSGEFSFEQLGVSTLFLHSWDFQTIVTDWILSFVSNWTYDFVSFKNICCWFYVFLLWSGKNYIKNLHVPIPI